MHGWRTALGGPDISDMANSRLGYRVGRSAAAAQHTCVIIALVCASKGASAKGWVGGLVKGLESVVPQPLAARPLREEGGAWHSRECLCLILHGGEAQAQTTRYTGLGCSERLAVLSVRPSAAVREALQQPAQPTFIRVLQSTPCQPAGQRHQPVEASHTPARCIVRCAGGNIFSQSDAALRALQLRAWCVVSAIHCKTTACRPRWGV